MSDEGDEKPKMFDISLLADLEERGDHLEDAARNSVDLTSQMARSGALMKEVLRNVGGTSALAKAVRTASSVSLLKDHLDILTGAGLVAGQMRAYQEATRAISLPDMKNYLPVLSGVAAIASNFKAEHDILTKAGNLALGGLPEGYLASVMGLATGSAASAVSRLVQDMRENSTLMFQKIDLFADMKSALEASSLFDFSGALSIPRFGSAIEFLGIGRIGSAFEAANAASLLGLSPTFHDEFKSVAIMLGEQASVFARLKDTAFAPVFDFDLADKLEAMLARSVVAQEALLAERREFAKDTTVDAAFNRRMAMIGAIINILVLLLSIAMFLEARLTDGDAAVRANTEALIEMRNSFDAMASQLEAMKKTQKSESEREDASDSEISGILRDIARTLSQQAETDAETDIGATDQPVSN